MAATALQLSPDDYQDRPWTEILPWLRHHLPGSLRDLTTLAPDWWLTESPAVSSMAVDHDTLCRFLARTIITSYPETTIGAAVPTLPTRLPLAALHTGTTARTTFGRLRAKTVGDLAGLSTQDLFNVRGTGLDTVQEILGGLISAAITRTPDTAWSEEPLDRAGLQGPPSVERTPAQTQLVDDLTRLACWAHARGRSDRPLLALTVEDGCPEEVQQAVQRLNCLTAADVAPSTIAHDPLADLAAAVGRLDRQQREVLRNRLFHHTPTPQARFAESMNTTEQQVKQVEESIKHNLIGAFRYGTSVGNLLASIRVELQPVASLRRIIALHPDLERDVQGFDVPLWLVLDRLDDHFMVTDGWAAAPDVHVARDRTRALLQDFADNHGVADVAGAAGLSTMPVEEFTAWLRWCGYSIHNGRALTRTATFEDHAAGVLAATGEPLGEDVLADILVNHAAESIGTRLHADERFVRSAAHTWGLVSWQAEDVTVRQAIERLIAAAGGAIPLDELVEVVTQRFGILPADVNQHATSGDFEVVNGQVQRTPNDDQPRLDPGMTRRLYRHGKAWRLRVEVATDQRAGSSFPVPIGVGSLLGCGRGDTVELTSRLGTQVVRWTGNQPTIASIKRFLDDLDAQNGDTVFLEFSAGHHFDVILASAPAGDADPLQHALALVGLPTTNGIDAVLVLAVAVGLPADAKPRQVLSRLWQRGDDDIAMHLERSWTRPSP